MIKYSVIILLEENAEGFADFVIELYDVFSSRKDSFEILIIANGTEGFLKNESKFLSDYTKHIKFFALNRKTSQAVCLKAALKESKGDIIVICGSYRQIAKDSFIHLLDSLDEETDIISPWRINRVDPPLNQIQSEIYNMIVRKITNTDLHDLSCTVKIVRREVFEETELYGNMYRFLPVLASRKGFKFKEVQCEHSQERGKTGVYGFFLYFERIIDIFTLYFNIRFTRKPLRFFGTIGILFVLSGMLIILYILVQKTLMEFNAGNQAMLLWLGFLFLAFGVQLSGVGLLGEIIVFIQGRNLKEYNVSYILSPRYCGPERRKSKYYTTLHFSRSDEKRRET